MRGFRFMTFAIILVSPGCVTDHDVRYVYQDKNFGVVGMPANTDIWPTYYHRRAENLMKEHFPEGHVIVRAEEVSEGSRTLKIEGSKTAEIDPHVPAELFKIAKLGRTSSRSQADVVKIKECRIIYRRAPKSDGLFAEDVDLCPTHYLDPNEVERKEAFAPHAVAGPPLAPKVGAAPSSDDHSSATKDVKKA